MFQDPILPSDSQGARAEGRVLEMSWADKLAYVRKYLFRHKTSASVACENFYVAQRAEWKDWVQSAPVPELQLGVFGDLMWVRKNWDNFLTPNALNRLRSLDGLVGNLETVLSPSLPIRSYLPDRFCFNSPPDFLDLFQSEGRESLFSALSFANNHTLDFGDLGVDHTLQELEKRQIPYAGVAGKPYTIFNQKNFRIGFLAATFGVNDPRELTKSQRQLVTIPHLAPERVNESPDLSYLVKLLAELQSQHVDAIIVCLHWGFEFEYYPTTRLLQVSQALADAGADFLFGCHPHIPHPPTILKSRGKRVLAYTSLGNFATAMYTFPCRLAPLQKIGLRKTPQGTEIFPLGIDWFFNQSWRGGRKLVSQLEFPFSNSHPDFLRLQKHLGV
jgi:hypothetical protein